MKHNIDLDIASLLKEIPPDNIVFYVRADESEDEDFFFAAGDTISMGETLAALMEQYPEIEQMVAHACLTFNK